VLQTVGDRARIIHGMPVRCDRTLIHKGAKFDFEALTVHPAGAEPFTREIVRHPGAVVVLPLLADPAGGEPRVVLIRNTRWALERELWELPAGTLEPPEPPEVCAVRELEEETGYIAGSIVPLGSFYTTPGMTDELMRAFLATDLTESAQALEPDERIVVEPTPLSRALEMLDRGELADAKSMLAVLLALRQNLLPPNA
jgi:ADP-ribose pyrophosphatase